MMAGSSSGLVSITIMITMMTMTMTITVARSLVVRAGIFRRSHSAVGAVAEVGNVDSWPHTYQ
jgi:hypothetical protein